MNDTSRGLGARWFEEVWNKQRRDAIAEMLAPDAPIHDGAGTIYGPTGFYTYFDRMQASFSEIHVTVQDTFAEGDKICVRWSCAMKHTGPGLGMPPTGKVLETTGITIVRVAGDKLAEGWQNWDMLGLMQQIQGSTHTATYMSS
jgi:predicted ester cyclase